MRPPTIALLLLAACAAPDLGLPEAPATDQGGIPRLRPLDTVLGETPPPDRIAPGSGAALEARAARLRARAAALRASALDPAERERIRAALQRLGSL